MTVPFCTGVPAPEVDVDDGAVGVVDVRVPGAGTPVQNGTVITFTTTLGGSSRPKPEQTTARSACASSPAARAALRQSRRSPAARRQTQNLRVGTAAAERVLVSATPAVLPPGRHDRDRRARRRHQRRRHSRRSGNLYRRQGAARLPGSVLTDSSGVAKTSLTATRNDDRDGQRCRQDRDRHRELNARTGVSITGPTTPVAAGTPVTFTIGVGAAPAIIRDVTVDFGDGAAQLLGALSASTPVQHVYTEEGTYRASATATDSSGFTETVATFVTILPAAAAERHHPGRSRRTRCRVRRSSSRRVVSGATSTILRYEWTFEGGTPADGNDHRDRERRTFTGTGTSVITVRVVQSPVRRVTARRSSTCSPAAAAVSEHAEVNWRPLRVSWTLLDMPWPRKSRSGSVCFYWSYSSVDRSRRGAAAGTAGSPRSPASGARGWSGTRRRGRAPSRSTATCR